MEYGNDNHYSITLPEELAKQAKAKGLLSPSAIESYVRDKLRDADIRSNPAFGIWKDRDGLADPVAVVRALRQGRGHAL